jgi:hypothetical protein
LLWGPVLELPYLKNHAVDPQIVPLASVVCFNCGHTSLYNAIMLKLIDQNGRLLVD